jgi:hypothetical protein
MKLGDGVFKLIFSLIISHMEWGCLSVFLLFVGLNIALAGIPISYYLAENSNSLGFHNVMVDSLGKSLGVLNGLIIENPPLNIYLGFVIVSVAFSFVTKRILKVIKEKGLDIYKILRRAMWSYLIVITILHIIFYLIEILSFNKSVDIPFTVSIYILVVIQAFAGFYSLIGFISLQEINAIQQEK